MKSNALSHTPISTYGLEAAVFIGTTSYCYLVFGIGSGITGVVLEELISFESLFIYSRQARILLLYSWTGKTVHLLTILSAKTLSV